MKTAESYPDLSLTQPLFLNQTQKIHTELKQKSVVELQELLQISEKLSELNYERMQTWQLEHTPQNSHPALFTYSGDIFRELSLAEYTTAQLTYAQKSIRILSGFYGLLRPLDLMQPYRLEMHTRLEVETSRDLYEFWTATLTSSLKEEISTLEHDMCVNVASQQYIGVINRDELSIPIIDIVFQEKSSAGLRTVPIYSKHARGMMIDYCIKNQAEELETIKQFDYDGYSLYQEEPDVLRFVR